VAFIARFLIWALILDDIVVFLQGGNSALGAFLDSILGAGTATDVLQFISDLWDSIILGIKLAASTLVTFLTEIGLLDTAVKKTGENWETSWGPVLVLIRTILGVVGDTIKAFTELDAIKGIGEALFQADEDRLNAEALARFANRPRGPEFAGSAEARAPGSPATRATRGSTTDNSDNRITVSLTGPQTPETVRTATNEARRLAGSRQRTANALVRGKI
jgi:hypothetical protein